MSKSEQVKKPRVMWVETSNRGQGKLPDLVYDVEPTMEDSVNKQHSIKVLEAQPVNQMLDKLELTLKNFTDWSPEGEILRMHSDADEVVYDEATLIAAREALNQLRNWRLK